MKLDDHLPTTEYSTQVLTMLRMVCHCFLMFFKLNLQVGIPKFGICLGYTKASYAFIIGLV